MVQHNNLISQGILSVHHRTVTYGAKHPSYVYERFTKHIFILKFVYSILIFTKPLTINTNNVVTFIYMLWYVLLGCNAGRIDTYVMYNYDVTYAVLQQS